MTTPPGKNLHVGIRFWIDTMDEQLLYYSERKLSLNFLNRESKNTLEGTYTVAFSLQIKNQPAINKASTIHRMPQGLTIISYEGRCI